MSTDIDVLKLEMRPHLKRSVTTLAGNVAGTTLVDNTLTEPDDFWNGMAILIRTAGATVDCSGQLRRVLDWDLATRTLTVNVPFTDPVHPADPKIEAGIQYVMSYPYSDPEVVAIEAKLDDPAHGLVKIKDEVANIETAVAPANGTTSANGNPGGTTVVDTTRTEPNDHWNNMALLIISGAQAGQVREIIDWVLGTGTFTVAPAFGGQILADVTYKILTHVSLSVDVAAIEAKLDHVDHGLEAIDTEVEAIEGKLDHETYGLANIKAEIVVVDTEIAAIEAKLDDPAEGLATIKAEVTAIEAKLDHETHGLANIKTEIVAVEAKLDHETHGLANIKAEIVAIEAKLDHETNGLASIKSEIVAIEAKLDHETNGLASIKTEIIAIEAKLDHETYGLAEIKSEVTSIETKVDGIKTETDKIAGLITESESHPTLAEIEAGDMATILTETQSHPTLAEIEAGDMASILADTEDIQPRIPRIVCHMDFWSDKDDEFLLNTTVDDKALPDVVVSGLPADITIIRVVAMFMCRAIEDTSAGANAINGEQYIQMRKAAGSWTNAIKLVDNLWAVADSIREMGDAFPGNIDLHTTVDGDATYNFQTHNVVVDGVSLKFNDLQVGLRVYFTV